METTLSALDVERRAKAAGGSMRDVCVKADISYSTFTRWRARKSNPRISIYNRIVDALLSIERRANDSEPKPKRRRAAPEEAGVSA